MPFYHTKGALLMCKRCPFEAQEGIFYKPVCNSLIICSLQTRFECVFVCSLNIRSSLSVILFLNSLLAFWDCLYMSLSTYESVRLGIPKSACKEWENMGLKCFVIDKNIEKWSFFIIICWLIVFFSIFAKWYCYYDH